MTEPDMAREGPTPRPGQKNPVFTLAEARDDRAERARQNASNCVLLAMVTSPDISAQLIDSAIDYARDRGDGAALVHGKQRDIALTRVPTALRR